MLPIAEVRAEFARRKVVFHNDEDWDKIALWGLFRWNDIARYIKSGQIIPNAGFTRANVTIWCRPSNEEWEQHIKPLIEAHTLDELSSLAGW